MLQPPISLAPTPSSIVWTDSTRLAQFDIWLAAVAIPHHLQIATLRPASADASFRRYFRIDSASSKSFIIMDAPPDKEDSAPFVRIAELLRKYANLDPDWADVSLVWLAETTGIKRIATVDVADFSVYRIHGRKRFELELLR